MSKTKSPFRSVDVGALNDALGKPEPPLVVDVRMPFEFASGHVPGAVNIPLQRIGASAGELTGKGEVWLVCRTGSRSSAAAKALQGSGLKLVNVEGGTMAWRSRGLPVARERSISRLYVPAFFAGTLGLTPFTPEPHVVGKLRWVLGGAEGMAAMDWFDLAMHGAPWVWLAWVAFQLVKPGGGKSGEHGAGSPPSGAP